MSPSAPTPIQKVTPFNWNHVLEQCKEVYERNGIPSYGFNVEMPTSLAHQSSVFPCMEHIRVRITPVASLYLLDFVDNSGIRIGGHTGLIVLDGEGSVAQELEPLGYYSRSMKDYKLEMYLLHPACSYQIRRGGQLLKTIRFPTTITVQCM